MSPAQSGWFKHNTGPAATPPSTLATTGLFSVVALRVEFAPDTTRFTTGDGTFVGDPYSGLVPRLDPLPHDEDFFGAHLQALEHYLETVSDGQVDVETTLLPEIVRVDRPMSAYSPLGLDASSESELAKLAGLVGEAWAEVRQTGADLSSADPDRTFFVLFHAGVGRDIELVGTTLDKTPLDLPSIFFSQPTLERLGIIGMSTNGLPVTNTAIIPRTETRRGFDFFSDSFFLTDLTTNGLLAASFLNFLGVPDLFDTTTGTSAIGPFGLMDPFGIFAYRGLIPPEPSAWTKLYLGWSSPIEVRDVSDTEVVLRAVADPNSSDVARVWVSESEYFLVENRHRDREGDGLVLRVFRDGVMVEQRFANGDETFNAQTIEGFEGGVVVAVDDYDWSLPGGIDEDGNDLLGGILIWHVDDAIIASSLPTNTVNADPARRGVDLEEADSGQDLGFPSQGLLGPALDIGTPFDFFFEGNPVRAVTASGQTVQLYRNRFGPDTYPSSETNGGGPSFVVIQDFSPAGATMQFRTFSEPVNGVDLVPGFPIRIAEIVGDDVRTGVGLGLRSCVTADASVVVVPFSVASTRSAGLALLDETSVTIVEPEGFRDSGVTCYSDRVWGVAADEVYAAVGIDPVDGAEADRIPLPAASDVFTPASSLMPIGDRLAIALTSPATTILATVDVAGGAVSIREIMGGAVSASFAGGSSVAVSWMDRVAVVDVETGIESFVWDVSETGLRLAGRPVFGTDSQGLLGAAVSDDGHLLLLGSDGNVLIAESTEADRAPLRGLQPILSDLDQDGRLDVIVTGAETLLAYSQGGAVINGFPIAAPEALVDQPLVSVSADGPVVLASSRNGYIYGYRLTQGTQSLSGFPLAVGGSVQMTPLMHGDQLYAVSSSGEVRSWKFSNLSEGTWPELGGSSSDLNYIVITDDGDPRPSGELLVKSETYNWPNPVRDSATRFRILATEDGTVDIDVVDMAGGRVGHITPAAVRAGVPQEFVWNAALESGLYFARVVVRSSSGRQDSKLIKLAVIR